ncbi:MAG: hypothetical protein VKJ24_17600 [Synechococcales bacterium]|nr:hypothetical protein [Synechococcales bacterium]
MRVQNSVVLTGLLTLTTILGTAWFNQPNLLSYRGSGRVETGYRGSGRVEVAYRGSGRVETGYRGSGRVEVV